MKKGEKEIGNLFGIIIFPFCSYHPGSVGYPRMRDYNQYSFVDGIDKPREGPNAREVSNAFFKRKERLHFEHSAVLLALIEVA